MRKRGCWWSVGVVCSFLILKAVSIHQKKKLWSCGGGLVLFVQGEGEHVTSYYIIASQHNCGCCTFLLDVTLMMLRKGRDYHLFKTEDWLGAHGSIGKYTTMYFLVYPVRE